MYEDDDAIEKTNIEKTIQPSESKWLKILMIIGSTIIAINFLFLIYYGIVGIVSIYKEISTTFEYINAYGLSIFNITVTFGVIILAIGFIGLARIAEGAAKIPLIISSIGLALVIIADIVARIINAILISYFLYGSSLLAVSIISIYFLIFKLFMIALSLLIVSFSKGKLKNQDKEFNLLIISSFTLPLWIIVIIASSIFMFLFLFGDTSSVIFLADLIALGINHVAHTIEFSLKVSKI